MKKNLKIDQYLAKIRTKKVWWHVFYGPRCGYV